MFVIKDKEGKYLTREKDDQAGRTDDPSRAVSFDAKKDCDDFAREHQITDYKIEEVKKG